MKKLSKEDKRKLWSDTKSYQVAAVLDKATSARLLQPLPTQFELQGKHGETLRLTTPARPPGQPAGLRRPTAGSLADET
jgi:hypothetical protein